MHKTFEMLNLSEKKKKNHKLFLLITAMPSGINCILKICWSSCCSSGMELHHLGSIRHRNLMGKTDLFFFCSSLVYHPN